MKALMKPALSCVELACHEVYNDKDGSVEQKQLNYVRSPRRLRYETGVPKQRLHGHGQRRMKAWALVVRDVGIVLHVP